MREFKTIKNSIKPRESPTVKIDGKNYGLIEEDRLGLMVLDKKGNKIFYLNSTIKELNTPKHRKKK